MRHARAYGIAGLGLAAIVVAGAFAQTTITPLPDNAPVQAAPLDAAAMADLTKAQPGDPKKGAALAGACAACHGLDGNATADPKLYPRIAGQSERYIARQLALYKAGVRKDGNAELMLPYAQPLSAQDMRDLGAHFATQQSGAGIGDDSVIAEGPNAGMALHQLGEKLYRGGDSTREIPACMACHGPTGAGNPGPAYPHVGGQQSWYVIRRLEEYRAGKTNEPDPALFQVMASVAKSLSDEDIRALGSYLQGLHPRTDDYRPDGTPLPPTPVPAADAAPTVTAAAASTSASPGDGAPTAAASTAAASTAAAPAAPPNAMPAPSQEPAAQNKQGESTQTTR